MIDTAVWRGRMASVLLLVGLSACASAPAPAPPGTVRLEQPVVAPEINTDEVGDELVQPPSDGPSVEQPGVIDTVSDIVDRAQRGASEQFNAFVLEVDDFFAGDEIADEPNTSFVRLRADAVKPALDSFELDPTVRVRLVLPSVEKRFRLLFSTEDELSDTNDEVERVSVDSANENVSLAVRFVQSARDDVDLGIDVGARRRDDLLQAFTRISAEYRTALSDDWQLRLRNRYFYFWRSGFDNRLRFDLTRSLSGADDSRRRFFRASTKLEWRATRRGATLGQTLGYYIDLGNRSALAVEGIATYDTALNDEIESNFRGGELRLRYRRNVWRPWFFVEFWPAVAFPAERDFRRTWNGLVRVEAIVGGEEFNAQQ